MACTKVSADCSRTLASGVCSAVHSACWVCHRAVSYTHLDVYKRQDAVQALQTSSRSVNAVLVQIAPGFTPEQVAEPIRRWKHLSVYTRDGMEDILIVKLIANSAKQIGMFLVILAIVSAAIVAFIIYTMTMGKLREIAVLKLIGTRDRTIAGMILQQALGLGLIGFAVGKVAATVWGLSLIHI